MMDESGRLLVNTSEVLTGYGGRNRGHLLGLSPDVTGEHFGL